MELCLWNFWSSFSDSHTNNTFNFKVLIDYHLQCSISWPQSLNRLYHLQCLLSYLQVLIGYLIDFKVFISFKIINTNMLNYVNFNAPILHFWKVNELTIKSQSVISVMSVMQRVNIGQTFSWMKTYEIPGYRLFRKDRKGNHGGFAVFVHDELVATRRDDLELDP